MLLSQKNNSCTLCVPMFLTMSSSLSSSSEFWEVDADRVEKNSSSQLALSSLHVGSVEVASKASTAEGVSDSDTELVSYLTVTDVTSFII